MLDNSEFNSPVSPNDELRDLNREDELQNIQPPFDDHYLWAIEPEKVSENINNKKISDKLKRTVQFIEKVSDYSEFNKEILYRYYNDVKYNIKKAISMVNNEPMFYEKLMQLKNYLNTLDINEDGTSLYMATDGVVENELTSTFNVEDLKNIKSYKGRIFYLKNKLQLLGQGSSRIVFKIDNQKVIKVAKNSKGIGQNFLEAEIGQDNFFIEVVAKVYDYDLDFVWIISEYASKFSEAEFKKIEGYDFKTFGLYLTSEKYGHNWEQQVTPEEHDAFIYPKSPNSFATNIKQLMRDYNMPVGDLVVKSSYGISTKNRECAVILIDYGIDEDVYKSYYSKIKEQILREMMMYLKDEQPIDERKLSYMPNSSSVEVKQNCRLAGKSDRTSDACNQGDIKNLNLRPIRENSDADYKKWKRDNVTYRGISEDSVDGENGGMAMLGQGLYSVPASNKAMARKYGKLVMLVNAKPKNPKIFNTLNDWEIWFQYNVVFPISKAKGKDYPDGRDVNSISEEMMKRGYDGVVIKGREIVNYKPEDVRYYYNERQLEMHYDFYVAPNKNNINEANGDGNKMKKTVLTNFLNKLEAYQSNYYDNIDKNDLVNAWRILHLKAKEYIKPNPKELNNLYRGADEVLSKKAVSFTSNKNYAKLSGTYVLPFSELQSYEGLISKKRVNKLIDGFKIDFSISDHEGEVIVLNPVWKKFDIEKYRVSELVEDLSYMHVDNAAPEQDKYMMGLEESMTNRIIKNVIGYHGTDSEFDINKVGENTGNYGHYGYGIYFSDDEREAKTYGNIVKKYNLTITNPFTGTDDEYLKLKDMGWNVGDYGKTNIKFTELINDTKDQEVKYFMVCLLKYKNNAWEEFWKKYPNNKNDYLNDLYNLYEMSDASGHDDGVNETAIQMILDNLNSVGIKLNPEYNFGFLYKTPLHYITNTGEYGKQLTNDLKKLGYDSVIYGSEIVIFDPKNIKFINYVTPIQDKYMMELKEGDNRNEMVYWHGGNLDDYSETIAQRNGRYEFGAGLYMTTSYEVVKKYTKGSRKLYKITVERGVDINDAFIDLEKALNFINTYVLTAKRKSIIEYLSKYIEDGKVPANIFNNLILNHKAIPSTKTKELRNFLIINGIDYEIVDNAFGFGEKMMVLYNMKKIKDVKRITSKDKIDNYNLLDESISDIVNLSFKQEIENIGGKLYSVGGAVRDKFLGKESKDLDVLITGVSFDQLEKLLSKYGRVDAVGKSFGILKFKPQGSSEEIDIAIPRTEKATGEGGHKGFEVTSDHALPIEKDLERRDFTINAIAKDAAGNVIDPYGGQEDLKNKIIRIVNPQAFSDDPLRMLRAVQFAARFDFTIEPKTEQLIKSNSSRIKEIPAERILTELDKIVKKGDVLYGADLLRETGLYVQIFGSKSPVGFEDHWDLDAWNNVKTMGEYIYLLAFPVQENPAEFYKKALKGDIPTYKEILALHTGFKNVSENPIKNRVVAHNMYTIYPESLNSKILPKPLLIAANELNSGKYPKGFKELAVTGNDLINKGLFGKELGDKLKKMLLSVYSDAAKNYRNELLNF